MVTKYCEFEPSQHRNKRVATFVFLDEPNDPHPLAICDVCSKKLLKMRPDAIVRPRKEQQALQKEKSAAKMAEMKDKKGDEDQEPSSSDPDSDAPESNTS